MSKRKQRQPDSAEILYRHYGPWDGRDVSLCRHLRAELDEYLMEMISVGEALNVTKAEIAACNITTFAPVDMTQAEGDAWSEQETKHFFWYRGCKCEVCGHIARGKLAQSTGEEKERWRREDEEAKEDDFED